MQLRRFVLPASVALTLMAASPALARNYFVRAGSTEAGTCTIDNGDHACSLEFAVHDAHFGDEITMAPGNYVLTQALEVPTRLLIHGAVGQPRPVISLNDANSAVTMNVLPFGTVLRHLEFTSSLVTGATVSLHDTTVEDTIIHATSPGTSAAVISDGTALRNTVIKMDGPDTDGVIALRATEELRNVTISGVDGSGDAITARCFDEPGATADSGGSINVINTIVAARGPNALFADGSNCDHGYKPTIAASSSSFDPLKVHRTAGGTYNEGADNVGPSSLAADGIHELAGSVSIDAGKVDALSPIDIDGEPRVQGKAVDIGADEFVPPPPPVVTPSAPAAPAPLPAPIKPTILNIPAIPPGLSGLTATAPGRPPRRRRSSTSRCPRRRSSTSRSRRCCRVASVRASASRRQARRAPAARRSGPSSRARSPQPPDTTTSGC